MTQQRKKRPRQEVHFSAPNGEWTGAVVHHASKFGMWMAQWPTRDAADCGMKAYRTFSAALKHVNSKIKENR